MRRRGVLLAAALGGCAAVSNPPEKRLYTLDATRPERRPARRAGPVLLLRPVQPGPGADQRGIVTRTESHALRTDYYAEFLTTPDVLVGDAMRRWLAASGRFAAVVDPGSRLPTELTLETTLTALEGVAPRAGEAPTARIALGILLLDGRQRPPRVLRQAVIDRSVSIERLSSDAVAAGLNRALGLALAEIEAELAPLVA